MEIINLVYQLVMRDLISIEQVDGREEEIVEFYKEAQVEALKELTASMKNKTSGCVSNSQSVLESILVSKIKA